MSDFDARWRRLAQAARSDDPTGGRIDARTAAAIAARARHGLRAPETSNLRALVAAAALFAASLPLLGWSAERLGLLAGVADVARDLGELARSAPATSFIPPPPRPTELGLPADLEPKLAFERGAALLRSLDDWLAPHPTTPEIFR
jgi:hypothetical protein